MRYPSEKMSAFVAALHAGGQHYVCIIDPGIHNSSGYAPYEQGLADGVFITNANSSDPAIGVVWPGTTAFPDFLSAGGRAYWADQVSRCAVPCRADGPYSPPHPPPLPFAFVVAFAALGFRSNPSVTLFRSTACGLT